MIALSNCNHRVKSQQKKGFKAYTAFHVKRRMTIRTRLVSRKVYVSNPKTAQYW
ncbi:hypothetical protein ENTCAN_07045 [Enterobacter cancerogenus ATCC 35316]|nr:hypothetical protein ENTCAN_07045 [Enterobacter cancerogenus ATCC 35316]